MKKVVNILAYIFTVLSIIGLVVLMILTALKIFDLTTFFVSVFSGVIELILIWALNNALSRIEALEKVLYKKGIIEEREIEEEVEKRDTEEKVDVFQVEQSTNIKYCKICGYQLFPEDKVCPNCGAKIAQDKRN